MADEAKLTSAELVDAATRWLGCECHVKYLDGACHSCREGAERMARHVLANVHADDDKAVTAAYLRTITNDVTLDGNMAIIGDWNGDRITLDCVSVRERWMCQGAHIATRGQLKSLLRGLGIPLKQSDQG